jgi:VanZ family protein
MLSLRHRSTWILLSALLVAGVMWGSLQTQVPGLTPRGYDKVVHFSTYLFCAVWFTGLVPRTRYGWVVLALLVLGGSMEIMQGLMNEGRDPDIYDMLANTCGVVTGLLLAWLLTGGWAPKIEAWML